MEMGLLASLRAGLASHSLTSRSGDPNGSSRSRTPHDAEDRGGRADTQSQRQDDDGGEARAASCGPGRIGEILSELVDEIQPVRLTNLFLVPLNAAERAQRRGAGVARTHAAPDVLGGLSLHVELQLVIELASHAASKHQRPEAHHHAL